MTGLGLCGNDGRPSPALPIRRFLRWAELKPWWGAAGLKNAATRDKAKNLVLARVYHTHMRGVDRNTSVFSIRVATSRPGHQVEVHGGPGFLKKCSCSGPSWNLTFQDVQSSDPRLVLRIE